MEKDIQYDYKIFLALNIINCNIFVECNNKNYLFCAGYRGKNYWQTQGT